MFVPDVISPPSGRTRYLLKKQKEREGKEWRCRLREPWLGSEARIDGIEGRREEWLCEYMWNGEEDVGEV